MMMWILTNELHHHKTHLNDVGDKTAVVGYQRKTMTEAALTMAHLVLDHYYHWLTTNLLNQQLHQLLSNQLSPNHNVNYRKGLPNLEIVVAHHNLLEACRFLTDNHYCHLLMMVYHRTTQHNHFHNQRHKSTTVMTVVVQDTMTLHHQHANHNRILIPLYHTHQL